MRPKAEFQPRRTFRDPKRRKVRWLSVGVTLKKIVEEYASYTTEHVQLHYDFWCAACAALIGTGTTRPRQ